MVHTIIIPKSNKAMPGEACADGSDEEQLESLHRQMLSSVSHDLKTPLASIIGALETVDRMRDKLSSDKQQVLFTVALQEAYRLNNFITNILDMAKLENNLVKVKPERIEIADLIGFCLTSFSQRLRGSTVNFKTSDTFYVVTDPVLLARAVSLVLDNALLYGGTPPVIHIETGRDSEVCFISIRDNGPGLIEAHLEKIFSKYTRFAREDQQNAGTGLGLAISRAMMKLLGGTLTAANHAEGGAQFTLGIPALSSEDSA